MSEVIGICECGYKWFSDDGEKIKGPSIVGPCPSCGSEEGFENKEINKCRVLLEKVKNVRG